MRLLARAVDKPFACPASEILAIAVELGNASAAGAIVDHEGADEPPAQASQVRARRHESHWIINGFGLATEWRVVVSQTASSRCRLTAPRSCTRSSLCLSPEYALVHFRLPVHRTPGSILPLAYQPTAVDRDATFNRALRVVPIPMSGAKSAHFFSSPTRLFAKINWSLSLCLRLTLDGKTAERTHFPVSRGRSG